jgi:hypothetical protein
VLPVSVPVTLYQYTCKLIALAVAVLLVLVNNCVQELAVPVVGGVYVGVTKATPFAELVVSTANSISPATNPPGRKGDDDVLAAEE